MTTRKNNTEAWLDNLDLTPEDMRDGTHLARVFVSAAHDETAVERVLAAAVPAAKAAAAAKPHN